MGVPTRPKFRALMLPTLVVQIKCATAYEFGCRDVAMQRLYKDFEITQNYFSYRNQQRQKFVL